jgi:hypothetical protein
MKALTNHRITSKLLWGCHQSFMQLAEDNGAQLIRVQGHGGIDGNETEQTVKQGSESPFKGP